MQEFKYHPDPDKSSHLVFLVDFDGTLTSDIAWPHIGKPNWPTILFLIQAKKDGHRLILWTARQGKELAAAIKAALEWGLEFHAVNKNLPEVIDYFNGNESRKVSGHIMLDDTAYQPNYYQDQPWSPKLLALIHQVKDKD